MERRIFILPTKQGYAFGQIDRQRLTGEAGVGAHPDEGALELTDVRGDA